MKYTEKWQSAIYIRDRIHDCHFIYLESELTVFLICLSGLFRKIGDI